MQRLVEQPAGEGDVVRNGALLGQAHYHLSVYRHFVGEAEAPGHAEVEGRLRGLDELDLLALHRAGVELTLRLADGRALDFRIIHEDGTVHSTGRGLHTPD
jgi:hypothetical protein